MTLSDFQNGLPAGRGEREKAGNKGLRVSRAFYGEGLFGDEKVKNECLPDGEPQQREITRIMHDVADAKFQDLGLSLDENKGLQSHYRRRQ
ncbi:MAG: hypothetical protein ACYC10_19015 [Allorhizobium sp.]